TLPSIKMSNPSPAELKERWRWRWIGSLFEFSHLEYQWGLWIEQRYPNVVGWFNEDMHQYFDDLNLDDHYESQIKNGIISVDEFEAIKEFHFAFDQYLDSERMKNPDIRDEEILNDEEWQAVVSKGLASWNRLKNIITDKSELEHMVGLEKNYLNVE
ncbi:hypothetical protein, partial [Cesiribacter sp. SM1]|uniref:hypothetical protein n=1 Tax=Cesiribacter sp. SM1 TaxID=2861196 RepID=UPI001CD1CECB